jgi:hypothetical protein
MIEDFHFCKAIAGLQCTMGGVRGLFEVLNA